MGIQFYKKGQGYYTRLGTALGGGVLSALGCWSLYGKLGGLRTGNVVTANLKGWIQAGVPAVLFAVLCWVIFKLVNTPRYADFMIATEGEMKKVSWSTKKELISSTKVVIFTVIVMAILLAVVDLGFANLFKTVGVLKIIPE